MSDKSDTKKKEGKLCGIYKVTGVRSKSQCKLKYINTIEIQDGQCVPDDNIKNIDIFARVNAEVFDCNITNVFLSSNKKIPLRYMSVLLNKPLRRVLLFRVYIYFTILDEVTSLEQFRNEKLNGKYTMELYVDDQLTELEELLVYPGDEEINTKLIKFVTSAETKEFIKTIVEDVNKRFASQYSEDLEYYSQMPTNIISLKDYVTD